MMGNEFSEEDSWNAYWGVLPIFGPFTNGIIFKCDSEMGRRRQYNLGNTCASVDFDGWQDSPRHNATLTEAEKTIDYNSDQIIVGLHSFVYPHDAIIWAWHWGGMKGINISVVPIKVHRDHFGCGGMAGYDIREYDTCNEVPAIVAKKLQVTRESLLKPIWTCSKKSRDKESLKLALTIGNKLRNRNDAISNVL